ncbi:hypothetical protein POUND7_003759 [Theobroma cacao]
MAESALPENNGDHAVPKIKLGGGFYYLHNRRLGQGPRNWIRVDALGNSQVIEVDKLTMKHHCDLPARDIRLLDPLLVYPSTILAREKAIVVNMEQIRCIITADEFLLLNSRDSYVLQHVEELQRRLKSGVGDDQIRQAGGPDDVLGRAYFELPFEFKVLEVALEVVCALLDSQVTEQELEVYPLLDALTSKVTTINLERVRILKSRAVALTRRVQKVRDAIEHLMDNDDNMAEMCLTVKKKTKTKTRMESSFSGDQSSMQFRSKGPSVSAPVSPVSSPPDSGERLKHSLTTVWGRRKSMRASESTPESLEDLEVLLESYFVLIDSSLNKLTTMKEYIDDTEDFINIQLDSQRNRLIQFELLVTTTTLALAIFGTVVAVFGMNFDLPFFDDPATFIRIVIIAGVCGIIIFSASLGFLKYKKLMPH